MNEWIIHNEALWLFYVLIADLFVGIYASAILTVEYFWGRSDTDIKREVVRRKAAKAKQKAEETVPVPVEVLKEIK